PAALQTTRSAIDRIERQYHPNFDLLNLVVIVTVPGTARRRISQVDLAVCGGGRRRAICDGARTARRHDYGSSRAIDYLWVTRQPIAGIRREACTRRRCHACGCEKPKDGANDEVLYELQGCLLSVIRSGGFLSVW